MVGRDGGGGERDEECWSFVLFLDRVASSAHPPTRYTLKAPQPGRRHWREEVGGPGGEWEQPGECSVGLFFSKPPQPHIVYLEPQKLLFGAEFKTPQSSFRFPECLHLKNTPVDSLFLAETIGFHDVEWSPSFPSLPAQGPLQVDLDLTLYIHLVGPKKKSSVEKKIRNKAYNSKRLNQQN